MDRDRQGRFAGGAICPTCSRAAQPSKVTPVYWADQYRFEERFEVCGGDCLPHFGR